MYPIVFSDVVHFSVREDGIIRKLATYIILVINDKTSIQIEENESSKYYLGVINSRKKIEA